jgi:tripartite-type tricarboxylate transporter receptor subunit TctC
VNCPDSDYLKRTLSHVHLCNSARKSLVVAVATGLCVSAVCAQDYPSRPIRIMTSEIGGGTDITARLIAQGISGPLGQPVVIDNRGSRFLGPLGAKAAPDGYTLIAAASTFMLGPLLEKTPYDPVRDFAPVTLATQAPNVFVIHPSLPAKTVKEFIALAKSRPKDLNYGSGGSGSSAHLAAELFNSMANVQIVRINYKGTGPALNDLLAGHVQMMIATPGSVTPNIKSGRLRALAVTSPKPSRLFPELPAVANTLPGYEITARAGVLAPAGTPSSIVNRLNQEIVRVLDQPDVKDKLFSLGVEAGGNTPAEFGAMIKSEMARMSKVIKAAGISPE